MKTTPRYEVNKHISRITARNAYSSSQASLALLDRDQIDTLVSTYALSPSSYGEHHLLPVFTSFACSGYRYGSDSYRNQGQEKDDEVKGKGNSYTTHFRQLDPRLGRWLSRDPLEVKYPDLSPYNFVANTPIIAIDPDGRWIIFINGEVGQFKAIGKSKANNRASAKYWSQKFVDKIVDQFSMYRDNRENYDFRDGDVGTKASTRYNVGQVQAKQDFEKILNQLEKNKDGKITETIKLVSHSKGSAYAIGYMDAWNELRNSDEHKDKFSGDGGLVIFNLMLAPHQSGALNTQPANKTFSQTSISIGISHDWDALSDNDVGGDAINIQTDNHAWSWEQIKAHTIDGFHFEAEAAVRNFVRALEGNWTPSYKTVIEGASKDVYNRETKEYDKNE